MPPQEKRTIVFSFDGTGNEPSDAREFVEDESITNVLNLHLLLGGVMDQKGEVVGTGHDKQLAFYYNGIGTREEGRSIPWLGKVVSAVNMVVAPTWGDARRILREARADFESSIRKDDRVVVFGYSRGAALARKFVAQLLKDEKCNSVAFLGVFDTVAALNGVQRPGEDIASDVLFENGTLDRRVEKAVHIVALDEDRTFFRPTLINEDPEKQDRITEIWFPGVHGDVGAGYWHDCLSDGALEFMIDQCHHTLKSDIAICPANDLGKVAKLLKGLKAQDHELADINIDDLMSRPMVDGPRHEHSGVTVKVGGRAQRHVRVNENNEANSDLPLVHKSVLERFQKVPGYRPPALRGLPFNLWYGSKSTTQVRGIAGLAQRPEVETKGSGTQMS